MQGFGSSSSSGVNERLIDLSFRMTLKNNNWHHATDINFGAYFNNFTLNAGTGSLPSLNGHVLGVRISANEKLKKINQVIRVNTQVKNIKFYLYFRKKDATSNADSTNILALNDIGANLSSVYRVRDVVVNWTAPTDGFIIGVYKATNALSSERYLYAHQNWIFEK